MSVGDVVGDERGEGVTEELGDVSNVLVLSSAMDSTARRAYLESFVTDPADTRVLAVNYTRSPDDWFDDWRSYAGGDPAACAIVSVGDQVRSAAAASAPGPDGPDSDPDWAVRSVESPDDLTGLGITIGEHLSEWAGGDLLITFDSLTVLLQYVDLQRAFRFLHVMLNRSKTAGAVGHYHLDPDAHDDRTVATLASLFDAVVEYDGDGEWSIRTQ